LYNNDGSLNWAVDANGTSSWVNPLSYFYNKYQNKTNNLVSNAVLSYRIIPDLEIKSSFGYTNIQINEFSASPRIGTNPEYRPNHLRYSSFTNSQVNSWIIEPQINYKKTFGHSNLNVLIGTTFMHNKTYGYGLNASGFNSDAAITDIRSASTITVRNSVDNLYKYNAVFGRVFYNWDYKYLLDITVRRDGSSRFGSENRFHNFWSVGGGWIFSNEEFFKNNINFISYGKLKGSYGTTGNDQIGDYTYLNLYNPVTVGVPYQGTSGLRPQGHANPYLQWEETKKASFGTELGFLKERILFNGSYSVNRSSNQLIGYALSIVSGFGSVMSNFPATIQNTSWEFTLDSKNLKTKDFEWNTGINLTIPKNELIEFPNLAESSYANTLIIGQPLNVVKIFNYIGVDPQTGVYQFADKDGNPTFSPSYTTDNVVLRTRSPKFYGGFDNSVSYKNFTLDFFFHFVKQMGSQTFNFGTGYPPGFRVTNQPVKVLDRWQKPGDIAPYQKYLTPITNTAYSMVIGSDANWTDASYIRLKNVSLSYQLPSVWMQKINFQSCKVYMQGQNFLTFTRYKDLDPESQGAALPPLQVITFGIQLGL
jgi:TonB-linked SusC/RagA family outer membrane protein